MNRSYATRHDVASSDAKPKEAKKEGHRETIEAIVVAMILALLVRGFEAEAFVIPTGSMAPTLMGRHKEVTCPQCKFVYSVNASGEEGGGGQPLGIGGFRFRGNAEGRPGSRVVAGTCVNCRFHADLTGEPTFNGDRILVMKFNYDMPFLPGASVPERWDVVVFRYPEEPEVSYIKRLVGLPGENLRIWHGNIYIKRSGQKDYEIARKPLKHQRAMAMMVYDDRHRAAAMWNKPEWLRWTSTTPTTWKEGVTGSYSIAAKPGEVAELRYRNLVPDPEQWEAILNEQELPRKPRPTLITDFYSYNTNQSSNFRSDDSGALAHPDWVGDLSLSARLDVKEAKGIVQFELVEGGVINRAEIDLAEGTVNLVHNGKPLNEGRATVAVGVGSHDIHFANFDNRLSLVVDGKPIFGDGLAYEDNLETPVLPTVADLAPAAVRAEGASVGVSDLVLKRDIYYTLTPGHPDYDSFWDDDHIPRTTVELFDNLANPSRFAFLANLPPKDYQIGEDRFLMLGDNSPMSRDSRGWNNDDRRRLSIPIDEPGAGWDTSDRASWEVPRNLLTGKAFFVYWPHGKPFGPDIRLNPDFRIPFRPYLERMKWIR
ncbi:signal peptidase I [Singulisphaera acidiphila]|uniref:Signal peptidase I n=1 Tax=Singulisphaera acidiphila (strain ATCC BAA-1392 / DSM 18658 / VKM B-2454 / MOB10) TaxID=886293 RepID=L0DA36_SINAD|nr:signal peptidase I [Singulisphaera acidiphila]AGA26244.1 signal peptidase I [Singulisphaera acidiphila DSM 18658]